MSNPVTNADIEDVLSSIRRLVSEEDRPAAPMSAPERLVLTPALRVMDAVQPEEILSGEPGTAEAAPAEDTAQDLPPPELLESAELAGVEMDETGRRNLEARIAELEAVISDTGGQWEQDGEEGGANAGGPVNALDWEDAVTDAAVDAIAEELLEQTSDMNSVPEAEFVHLEEHDAPEATVSPISDQMERPVETVHEDAPQEAPAPEADAPSDTTAEYTGTDFIVDEEMLRDLVAQIVRQELQGALGERITRNVRKLVRREIHRALASQELE